MPTPQPIPPAEIPGLRETINQLDATTTGGVFRAAGDFELPQGVVVTLQNDLIVIVQGDLTISGEIRVPEGRTVNIMLASQNGSILIIPTAVVGHDHVDPPRARSGAPASGNRETVRGKNGGQGGWISILAPSGVVDISGTVGTLSGGDGGDATALAGFGSRTAIGGAAGAGGDIVIASPEGIIVDGMIMAGHGGEGGNAWAFSLQGTEALAQAGDGNNGGNIKFLGLGQGAQEVPVRISADVIAGNAGAGKNALARGGSAKANGGDGLDGGQIEFVNTAVTWLQPAKIDGGRPGAGGVAWAGGGAVRPGQPGTNAHSEGGDAGAPANAPQVPVFINPQMVIQPGTVRGQAGPIHEDGGEARSMSGRGGSETAPNAGDAQPSGQASAHGGLGSTRTPTTTPSDGPNPPAGGNGGVPALAVSPGS